MQLVSDGKEHGSLERVAIIQTTIGFRSPRESKYPHIPGLMDWIVRGGKAHGRTDGFAFVARKFRAAT